MDRANVAAIERAEILARFPEFKVLVHSVPYLTKRQNEVMLARLARNAIRLDGGCIVWNGTHNNDGYGRMTVWSTAMRKHYKVCPHQVVLRMATGRGLQHWQEVSHSCDTPPCFNPKHLSAERIKFNRRRSAENTKRKKARRAARERFAGLEARDAR